MIRPIRVGACGVLFVLALFATAEADAAQCEFVNKKGEACKREAEPGSKYCAQHGKADKPEKPAKPDKPEPPDKTKKPEPAKPPEKPTVPAVPPKDAATPWSELGGKAEDLRWRTILRAMDGDTLLLDGNEKVRLIGVDAFETADGPKLDEQSKKSGRDKEVVRELGLRAAGFAKDQWEGKKVKLETDEQKQDADGKVLVYLRLEDGHVANAEIVRAGYAAVREDVPFKPKEAYGRLEAEAKEARRGLWGPAGVVRRAIVKLADGQVFEKVFVEEKTGGAWVSVEGKRYWYPKSSIAAIQYIDPLPPEEPGPAKPAEDAKPEEPKAAEGAEEPKKEEPKPPEPAKETRKEEPKAPGPPKDQEKD